MGRLLVSGTHVRRTAPAQPGESVHQTLGHLVTDADTLEDLDRDVGVLARRVLVQAVHCQQFISEHLTCKVFYLYLHIQHQLEPECLASLESQPLDCSPSQTAPVSMISPLLNLKTLKLLRKNLFNISNSDATHY